MFPPFSATPAILPLAPVGAALLLIRSETPSRPVTATTRPPPQQAVLLGDRPDRPEELRPLYHWHPSLTRTAGAPCQPRPPQRPSSTALQCFSSWRTEDCSDLQASATAKTAAPSSSEAPGERIRSEGRIPGRRRSNSSRTMRRRQQCKVREIPRVNPSNVVKFVETCLPNLNSPLPYPPPTPTSRSVEALHHGTSEAV
jgi:hypothetical protein